MFYFIFFVVSPTHKSNCKDKRWKYIFKEKTINIKCFLDNWICSNVCHERKRDYIWIKVIRRSKEAFNLFNFLYYFRYYSAVESSKMVCTDVRQVQADTVRIVMHETRGW